MGARTGKTRQQVETGGPLEPEATETQPLGTLASQIAAVLNPPAPQPAANEPPAPAPVLPPTEAPPIKPQAPPSPQPTVPPGTPQTQPVAGGAASFGRGGLAPGANISTAPTFAQTGGKEAWRRGFTGALFSPESIFSSGGRSMGRPGLDRPQVPTAMGGGGGITLTPSPTPGGGGVPFDGGLGAGPGWPGATDPVQQMIMAGMMRQ